MENPGDRYKALGASASKAGLHLTLDRVGMGHAQPYFCTVQPDLAGSDSHLSFLHCDGAGTKAIVAYLLYRATGDPSAFAGLAQDALVMNLDDIYCLGLPDALLLSNNIARNSKLISDEAVGAIIQRYRELSLLLSPLLGVELSLGGGETADMGDVVRTVVVDAVLTGRIAKSNLINPQRIKPGDVIIGLSNTGQASYEAIHNSSIGSNGLTLARHALLRSSYIDEFPEVVDPGLDRAICYTGPFGVTDSLPDLAMTAGQALCSPTRCYAPVLSAIYRSLGQDVHGGIHVTGGGLTKVLRFGSGNRYVKNQLFETPPLFKLIQQHGKVAWREMYQVFNMGHRIELYLEKNTISTVVEIAKKFGIEAKQIGVVERNSLDKERNAVVVESAHGVFEYTL